MGGTTTGGIRIILRLEGLGILILALAANSKWGIDWRNFALFFFAPDISMLGYFAGPRIGAVAYNSGHSYLGGMVCIALGVLLPVPILLDVGILWLAHIGFDRSLGYGLKYSSGFKHTHLGTLGAVSSAPESGRRTRLRQA
jgi:hypothetical protein